MNYSKVKITKDNYRRHIEIMCRELDQLGSFINIACKDGKIETVMKTQKQITECNEFLARLLEFYRFHG